MSNKTIPAISVIIPMYNAEKYVGECLDSILNQTFTDYEVIVVDDCSTDKSCEIVEKYMKTGGGRLKLIRSKINSGGAGTPRNTGLRFSRGEYIFFMDSDDAIVEEALQKIYDIAKEFDADVLHCGKYYRAPDETVTTNKQFLTPCNAESNQDIEFTKLATTNIEDRVKDFISGKTFWAVWNQIVKRDLIVQQNFSFSPVSPADDFIFTFIFVCAANNFVHLSTPYYIWRTTKDSLSRSSSVSLEKFFKKWCRALLSHISVLDKTMSNFNLFTEKIQYKYEIFDYYYRMHVGNLFGIYSQIPAYQFDSLIRRELEQFEDKTALSAFLFSRMNVFNVNLIQQQNLIRQQQQQIQQLQAQLSQISKSEDIFRL